MDLREVSRVLPPAAPAPGLVAPCRDAPSLQEMLGALRADGESVVVDLPGHERERRELACDRELVLRDGAWQVERLK